MKIMLIRYHDKKDMNTRMPESVKGVQGVLPPLSLAYLAGVLEKEGYEVKIVDALALNLTKKEFDSLVKKEKPDICGVTCTTITFLGALEALSICKKNRAITVIGGVHLSVYPKETLSHKFIDYGIAGEGEYALLELVRAIESKSAEDIRNIKGLVYREKGKVICNGERIVEDIDSLPMPAYHLLPVERYSLIIDKGNVMTVMASRGCPFQCDFCFKSPSNRVLRIRKPELVVKEIEYLKENLDINSIIFYDDTFTFNRKFVEDFCNLMIKKKLGVVWEAPTRVDRVDSKLLVLMKKAGCFRLKYGVESGNERILRMMHKGITRARVKEVFRLSRKAGIEAFAYFMIGYATETKETINDTINFAVEIDADYAIFSAVIPCPRTGLYDYVLKEGIIKEDYWRKFTLGKVDYRFPYLVKDADEWVKKAYRRFYIRPKYIMRRIKSIKRWEDIRNSMAGLYGLIMFKMENM